MNIIDYSNLDIYFKVYFLNWNYEIILSVKYIKYNYNTIKKQTMKLYIQYHKNQYRYQLIN